MKLAIIGDFNPLSKTHEATNKAIRHSAKYLDIELTAEWIPTDNIANNRDKIFNDYNGFWIAPGGPYKSMDGVLEVIQFARVNHIPAFGTCGGFQQMAIEFARNILHITDAQHAEYDPNASKLLIKPLSCSLAGQTLNIIITDHDSITRRVFNTGSVTEKYYCNFGLDPEYQSQVDQAGFKVVGVDEAHEARILELTGHPFFIATLFVPQDNSTFETPHKLVTEFISKINQSYRVQN
jgi:CTP synthase (UTP-ammonia lyase)